MEDCLKIIKKELEKSRIKIVKFNNSDLKSVSNKLSTTISEIKGLNTKLSRISNKYIKDNNLNEIEISKFKEKASELTTDFLHSLNIPGTNPNFKINI